MISNACFSQTRHTCRLLEQAVEENPTGWQSEITAQSCSRCIPSPRVLQQLWLADARLPEQRRKGRTLARSTVNWQSASGDSRRSGGVSRSPATTPSWCGRLCRPDLRRSEVDIDEAPTGATPPAISSPWLLPKCWSAVSSDSITPLFEAVLDQFRHSTMHSSTGRPAATIGYPASPRAARQRLPRRRRRVGHDRRRHRSRREDLPVHRESRSDGSRRGMTLPRWRRCKEASSETQTDGDESKS